MEVSRKLSVTALLGVLGLWLYIWLTEGWLGSSGAGMPVISRMAFCAAAVLYALPALNYITHEPAEARFVRLRRAAVQSALWFVIMIILLDVRLPSGDAVMWLVSAGVFGLIMAFIIKPTQSGTAAAASGFTLYAPFLVWALAGFLVLGPILDDQGFALFGLILFLGLAAPENRSLSAMGWKDWLLSGLAVAAALTGLFTAP